MATFQEKLTAGWNAGKFVCVGIDPRMDMIPPSIAGATDASKLELFCLQITRATAQQALAIKPNLAFFLRAGGRGIDVLRYLCNLVRIQFPEVVLILDAKYGDIGDTNEASAEFAFDLLGVDAVTLNPYVGRQAHEPFLRHADKGCIFLVKTSDPGAAEYQDQFVLVQDEQLNKIEKTATGEILRPHWAGNRRGATFKFHQLVAHQITHGWNTCGNCGVVVGATYPGDLSTVRTIVGGAMPILIPGIGAQGGDLMATVNEGMGSGGHGMVINASRSLIHASTDDDFAEAAARATLVLSQQILACLGDTDG